MSLFKPKYSRDLITIKNHRFQFKSEEGLDWTVSKMEDILPYIGIKYTDALFTAMYKDYMAYQKTYDLVPYLFPFRIMFYISCVTKDPNIGRFLDTGAQLELMAPPFYMNLPTVFRLPWKVQSDMTDVISRCSMHFNPDVTQEQVLQIVKSDWPRYFSALELHKEPLASSEGIGKYLEVSRQCILLCTTDTEESKIYVNNIFNRKFYENDEQ